MSGADRQGLADQGLTLERFQALARPEVFPHDPSAVHGVESIQTHISYVLLTRDCVYKFRKPVDLGFVRFASRESRNRDCLREVALNRRLAPDVYRGIAPLTGVGAGTVGPAAEGLASDDPTPEHCVVMRRLPAGRDALSLVERGALGADQIERVARTIARFHRDVGLGMPAPFGEAEWRACCTKPVADNFSSLAESLDGDADRELLRRSREAVASFEGAHAARFEARRRAGCAVDGHGDLHLQHVWFERDEAEPLVIDCLEFNDSLRRIDAASEVAFLAMDLRYRGAPTLAARFLRVYADESGDFDLYCVVDYFMSYRAGVRAKVAAIAARAGEISETQRRDALSSARRHLELCAISLQPVDSGLIVLVAGVVGTGKSTAAAALAELLEGVVLSSDRVRKRLLDLPQGAHAGGEAYTPHARARVYATLRSCAEPVVRSGRVAILDATWSERRERDALREAARVLGVPVFLVETRCAAEVALARLTARAAAGTDASDAGPERHPASAAAFEAPEEWPARARVALAMDGPGWEASLREIASRVRATRKEGGPSLQVG